jgi:hypothetical protein
MLIEWQRPKGKWEKSRLCFVGKPDAYFPTIFLPQSQNNCGGGCVCVCVCLCVCVCVWVCMCKLETQSYYHWIESAITFNKQVMIHNYNSD